jgi:hypothetical protein
MKNTQFIEKTRPWVRVTRRLKKIRPIFENVAKIVAKISKLKLKTPLFNVKLGAGANVIKLFIAISYDFS